MRSLQSEKLQLKLMINIKIGGSLKKIIFFLLICSIIFVCPKTIYAAQNISTIEYLEDGSYFITSIDPEEDHTIKQRAASSTRSGKKTVTYKSKSGSSLWSVTINGTFSYNGNSSSCTKSTVSATSYSSSWKIGSKSASKKGNKATGTATGKQYNGSISINSISQSVTLTCNKNGVLS